jgi:aspartate racemase
VIGKAREEGADGVILGCTELSMILGEDDADLPVFDTTQIHARAASDFAFGA